MDKTKDFSIKAGLHYGSALSLVEGKLKLWKKCVIITRFKTIRKNIKMLELSVDKVYNKMKLKEIIYNPNFNSLKLGGWWWWFVYILYINILKPTLISKICCYLVSTISMLPSSIHNFSYQLRCNNHRDQVRILCSEN